jgi:hypothetical protein
MSLKIKKKIRAILIFCLSVLCMPTGCTYKSNDWVRPGDHEQMQNEEDLADCEEQAKKYAVPIFGINITGGVSESWSRRKYVVECMQRKGYVLDDLEEPPKENK